MASKQMKQMTELYASIKERVSKPGLDLATNRDIVENLHLAAIEPEAVTYAEVNADGVPALWCIPLGSDPDRVLLHSHSGGSVVTSMHTDRKAIGHIAKAVGVRALVLNFRRAPEHKFPAQIEDVEKAYRWLLAQKIRPENIASIGHSIGGNLAVSLVATQRDEGHPLPGSRQGCRRSSDRCWQCSRGESSGRGASDTPSPRPRFERGTCVPVHVESSARGRGHPLPSRCAQSPFDRCASR